MSRCTRPWYAYEDRALDAGQALAPTVGVLDVLATSAVTAYQCRRCRYPDGRKAWHWERRP
jgi:hypothetical protein